MISINQSSDYIISQMIEYLRIPLIILVVFVHIGVEGYSNYDKNADFLTVIGFFSYICDIVSFIANCAVPSFFLISGYLFFRNIDRFDFVIFLRKYKSRIKTLLVPYLFWNLLVFLWGCLIFCINSKSILDICDYLKQFDIYDVFVAGRNTGTPYYMIMWYVRDLIFLTLLTPLFYFVFKYLKAFAFIPILILYISVNYLHWLGTLSIAFFSFGVSIGLFKINIEKILNHSLSKALFCFSIFLLGLYPLFLYSDVYVKILKVLVVFDMFYIVYFTRNFHLEILKKYSSCSFFVYCIHILQPAHKCTLLALSTYLVGNSIGRIPYVGSFFTYLISPLLTFLICLFIYTYVKKWFPRFIKVVSGAR